MQEKSPGGPCGPCGPVAPAGPRSPRSPGGPCGPAGPVAPFLTVMVSVLAGALWGPPRAIETRKPDPAAAVRLITPSRMALLMLHLLPLRRLQRRPAREYAADPEQEAAETGPRDLEGEHHA